MCSLLTTRQTAVPELSRPCLYTCTWVLKSCVVRAAFTGTSMAHRYRLLTFSCKSAAAWLRSRLRNYKWRNGTWPQEKWCSLSSSWGASSWRQSCCVAFRVGNVHSMKWAKWAWVTVLLLCSCASSGGLTERFPAAGHVWILMDSMQIIELLRVCV